MNSFFSKLKSRKFVIGALAVIIGAGGLGVVPAMAHVERPEPIGTNDSCYRQVLTSTNSSWHFYRGGSHNNSLCTKRIQKMLSYANGSYGLTRPAIDGSFGSETERAVKAFQKQSKISSDGKVGPSTYGMLFNKYMKVCVAGPWLAVVGNMTYEQTCMLGFNDYQGTNK